MRTPRYHLTINALNTHHTHPHTPTHTAITCCKILFELIKLDHKKPPLAKKSRRKMGDEKVKNEAMEIMGLFQVLPRLVVFDLDYTLWPFYCECRSKRETPSMYPHAKGILYALKEKGVDMAIASRSPTRDIAEAFIDKLGIKPLFVAQEIFSSWSHKTEHFKKIQQKTRVPYESMLFFDDEDRNIESVSKMGVTSILVNNGVTLGAFRQGLTQFSKGPSSSKKDKKR
ncbi:putative protein-tyrosine-phosphatase [Helianthus debilis subsp. tardiflorus]